jgi:hypothetical protein
VYYHNGAGSVGGGLAAAVGVAFAAGLVLELWL